MDRIFASTLQRDDNGLHASYNISLLIAKSGKSHTIGEESILPAVEEILKTFIPKSASDIIRRIPLRNNSVQRRIDEMSQDVESVLCDYLQTTHFSLQLDESTLPGNESLLLAYVRFIMDQEYHAEKFARTLTTDTKGESIFNVLKEYLIENSIPLSNIISVATDGASAMVGRYRGFIGHLKQNVPGVLAIHCVIHRQHLVAKNLNGRLHESVQFVINTINRIRSNALNTRLFAQLCEENDEHFHQLLLHKEVLWLSKSLCLTRIFAPFETILEFLDSKDTILRGNLIKRKTDIAYLTDFLSKFNDANLQLQGDSLNLIKTKSIISAFLARIKIMKRNIGQR
ncbi:SCAN domain-containing protein 3 [Trichonephila clavipes]|nr:SCAN domain-containing protein 3 [Trichonephila clavipes]